MKQSILHVVLAVLGGIVLLSACSREAEEKRRLETELRIIQCEAGRWGGQDNYLARLFLDSSEEIRDAETAKIACQAANTGHMVFSTVHANDTISALYQMG